MPALVALKGSLEWKTLRDGLSRLSEMTRHGLAGIRVIPRLSAQVLVHRHLSNGHLSNFA